MCCVAWVRGAAYIIIMQTANTTSIHLLSSQVWICGVNTVDSAHSKVETELYYAQNGKKLVSINDNNIFMLTILDVFQYIEIFFLHIFQYLHCPEHTCFLLFWIWDEKEVSWLSLLEVPWFFWKLAKCNFETLLKVKCYNIGINMRNRSRYLGLFSQPQYSHLKCQFCRQINDFK